MCIFRQTSFTESGRELATRNSNFIQKDQDRRKSLTSTKVEDEKQYQSLIRSEERRVGKECA